MLLVSAALRSSQVCVKSCQIFLTLFNKYILFVTIKGLSQLATNYFRQCTSSFKIFIPNRKYNIFSIFQGGPFQLGSWYEGWFKRKASVRGSISYSISLWHIRVCQIQSKIHFLRKLIMGSEKMEPFDVLNMGNILDFHLEHSSHYLIQLF